MAHQSAAEWEVFVGTYTASGTTLARTSVLASSNGGSAVSFSAGTKDVFLTYPAGRAVHGQGGADWTPASIASATTVADFDPDTVSGNDGDAIASVASQGSAAAFTQSTGANKPLLRKAANGCNSHNVLEFDASNDYIRAATGGTALTGAFDVWCVLSWHDDTNYEHAWCFGEATDGHRRGLLKRPSGDNGGRVEFNGQNADVQVAFGTYPALDTFNLVRIRRTAGGLATISIDGTDQTSGSPSLSSFTGDTITIGGNTAGGENFGGKIARVLMFTAPLSDVETGQLAGYLATRFALTVAGGASARPLPRFTAAQTLGEANVYQDGSGNVIVGGTAGLGTYVTGSSTRTGTAALTVYGAFTVYAGASVPGVTVDIVNQNAFWLQNLNHAGGLTALVGLDYSGAEMWAIGRGNPSGDTSLDAYPFYPKNDGSRPTGLFLETSTGGSTSANCTEIVLIQTGTLNSVTGYHRRIRMDKDGNIILYAVDAAFPSETPALTVRPNGAVKIEPRASAPSSPVEGDTYYDSTTHKHYGYNGSGWQAMY